MVPPRRVEHRRVARTPVALNEAARRITHVITLHLHRVGSAGFRRDPQPGVKVAGAIGGGIVGIVGEDADGS